MPIAPDLSPGLLQDLKKLLWTIAIQPTRQDQPASLIMALLLEDPLTGKESVAGHINFSLNEPDSATELLLAPDQHLFPSDPVLLATVRPLQMKPPTHARQQIYQHDYLLPLATHWAQFPTLNLWAPPNQVCLDFPHERWVWVCTGVGTDHQPRYQYRTMITALDLLESPRPLPFSRP